MADFNDGGRVLSWDDEIEQDGGRSVKLPEGDYEFEIIRFEKKYFNGSDKMPPCPMACLHFQIESEHGRTIIKQNYILHSRFESQISELFLSIGLKRYGEKTVMKWDQTIGKKGIAHVKTKTWVNSKGESIESNEIQYLKEVVKFTPGKF